MRVCPTQPDLRGKPRHTCRSPSFCPSNTRPGPLDGRSPYSARPQRQTEADFSEPPTFCPSPGPLDGRIPYSDRPGWHTEADFSEDPLSARQILAQGLLMGVVPTQPDLRGKPRPTFRSHPLSALRQGLCLFHGRISYSARPIGPGRQPPSKPRLSPLTSERQYATLGRVCLSLAHTPGTISFNSGRVGWMLR